jgi:hypothetical protein
MNLKIILPAAVIFCAALNLCANVLTVSSLANAGPGTLRDQITALTVILSMVRAVAVARAV